MIIKHHHQTSTKRTLQSLIIFREADAIAYIDHYPIHNAPQKQASKIMCTDTSSPIATINLHPFILLDENTPPFFWSCVVTNPQHTIHEGLLQNQRTWLKNTPMPLLENINTLQKIVLTWIVQRNNWIIRRRLFRLFSLVKAIIRPLPLQKAYTTGRVSGRPSSTLILVSLV